MSTIQPIKGGTALCLSCWCNDHKRCARDGWCQCWCSTNKRFLKITLAYCLAVNVALWAVYLLVHAIGG